MGDPLSIVGSVAGLISLGIQVTQSLVDFYTSYEHQHSELAGTIEKLDSLLTILESLEKTLSTRKFQVDERSLLEYEWTTERYELQVHESWFISRYLLPQ